MIMLYRNELPGLCSQILLIRPRLYMFPSVKCGTKVFGKVEPQKSQNEIPRKNNCRVCHQGNMLYLGERFGNCIVFHTLEAPHIIWDAGPRTCDQICVLVYSPFQLYWLVVGLPL